VREHSRGWHRSAAVVAVSSTTALLIAMTWILSLILAVLFGMELTTRRQRKRSQRQAEQQRVLNESWRALEKSSGQSRLWWESWFYDNPPSEGDEEE
jgi:ABC-type bacteriocin/lantibiotic exporter with double-glycine peptidase domain